MLQSKDKDIIITNEKSILKIIDDGIIHILYTKNSILEVQDLKEVKDGINLLAASKLNKFKVLTELQAFVSITPEARIYGAEHSPEVVAGAYVIKGLSQRLLVSFHLKTRKIMKPTKVFQTSDEALIWLNSM